MQASAKIKCSVRKIIHQVAAENMLARIDKLNPEEQDAAKQNNGHRHGSRSQHDPELHFRGYANVPDLVNGILDDLEQSRGYKQQEQKDAGRQQIIMLQGPKAADGLQDAFHAIGAQDDPELRAQLPAYRLPVDKQPQYPDDDHKDGRQGKGGK